MNCPISPAGPGHVTSLVCAGRRMETTMETKRHMWLGKQAGFGISRHHLDAPGVLGSLHRKRGRVEILRARPRRGVGQQYSGAGGLITCPDGLESATVELDRRILPKTAGYR